MSDELLSAEMIEELRKAAIVFGQNPLPESFQDWDYADMVGALLADRDALVEQLAAAEGRASTVRWVEVLRSLVAYTRQLEQDYLPSEVEAAPVVDDAEALLILDSAAPARADGEA